MVVKVLSSGACREESWAESGLVTVVLMSGTRVFLRLTRLPSALRVVLTLAVEGKETTRDFFFFTSVGAFTSGYGGGAELETGVSEGAVTSAGVESTVSMLVTWSKQEV